jgi:prepilin-type N-terminal cleavage/methylation domain-containing protein
MKQGFTLIELLIATALASIISATLIAMWQQMNQVRSRVDRYADMYQRAALVCAQLERDLSGVFLPVEADISQADIADQGVSPEGDRKKEDSKPGVQTAQKPPAPAAAAKQEGPKKLEKAFWGDHGMNLLTFVTNNIMQRYWSIKLAQTTQAQPRMARVVYKLVPEAKKKDSFVLMRQESPEIYFDVMQQKGAQAYALATGIKAMRIDYVVYVKIPAEKKGANPPGQQQNQEPAFEKKVVKEWFKVADNKPPWPFIPQWVLVEVDFWDTAHAHVQTFRYEFQILPRWDKKEPPVAQRPVLPNMPQNKPGTSTPPAGPQSGLSRFGIG